MMEPDTIRLLRECDAGAQMGTESIADILPDVKSDALKQFLTQCREEHLKLQGEIQALLDQYHDEGKDPNPVARGMSWIKTNVKLAMEDSDRTVADLTTDGCNMGVKSLNKYLNQYTAASQQARDIAKRLIHLEQALARDIRRFL